MKAFKNSFPIVGVSGSLSELMEMSHHLLSVFDQLPLDTFAQVRNNLNDTFLFNIVFSCIFFSILYFSFQYCIIQVDRDGNGTVSLDEYFGIFEVPVFDHFIDQRF